MMDIPRRIDRLQRRIDAIAGTLPADELLELQRLEAEHEREFPNLPAGFADFTSEMADRYIAYHASDVAARVDELRRKMRTPAEVAADEANRLLMAEMSIEELDEYMAARLTAYQEKYL